MFAKAAQRMIVEDIIEIDITPLQLNQTAGDALREMEDISDVKLQQVRGEAPVQFAFNFNWKSGGQ